jgi:hypothetical protein
MTGSRSASSGSDAASKASIEAVSGGIGCGPSSATVSASVRSIARR